MSALAEKATPLEGARNISLFLDGKVLYVLCDLSKDFGVSSSGKSTIIGTTSGNKPLGKSGGFLGVNIFIKDLTKRKLESEAVADLRKDEFQDCSEGCQWRVEKDGVTLCVKIDFATVKERDASSGKTVLMATSGSFKAVGTTGISFNLNCYRQKDGTFDPSKITEEPDVGELHLAAGSAPVVTGTGYTVDYKSATEAVVTFKGNVDSLTEAVSLKDCKLDATVTVTMSVMPLKAKKAKKEAPAKEGGEAVRATSGECGGLLGAPAEKVQNVRVTCSGKSSGGDFDMTVTFDPSHTFALSGSGKSLTVGTTGGFQEVGGPDGTPVCRLQFLAYKPAPGYNDAKVKAAVATVLGRYPATEIPTLTINKIMGDVLAELGADEALKDSLKAAITAAAKEFVVPLLSPSS